MSPYLSILKLSAPPGRLEEAITQFIDNRVIEICKDAIPGFLSGRLVRPVADDVSQAWVLCEWTDQQAFEDWMNSPLRGGGNEARLFMPPGRSELFQTAHAVVR